MSTMETADSSTRSDAYRRRAAGGGSGEAKTGHGRAGRAGRAADRSARVLPPHSDGWAGYSTYVCSGSAGGLEQRLQNSKGAVEVDRALHSARRGALPVHRRRGQSSCQHARITASPPLSSTVRWPWRRATAASGRSPLRKDGTAAATPVSNRDCGAAQRPPRPQPAQAVTDSRAASTVQKAKRIPHARRHGHTRSPEHRSRAHALRTPAPVRLAAVMGPHPPPVAYKRTRSPK